MTFMERESELDLVSRLRASDPSAFDLVYQEFNLRLFNFLVRLARRRDVAEDLLEETWLRVVDRAPKLKPDTALGPFLFTVARNLYISYCRSRQIEDTHAPALIGLWPSGSNNPSPFETTLALEMQTRLELALDSLPATYREALLLVGAEEMRPADAAAICGISPEAMRQRISRARALLAQRLEERDASRLQSLKVITT